MDIYSTVDMMKRERKTVYDLKIRVTFYARVSTTRDEQENSIENQIAYFTNMIKKNPNWNYVEGYADRIRGESAANRTEFMRMVEDGKNGRFDLILTKEISRFARNTIDSLTYTRELLKSGVGVLFQNDNICTIDADSELRLTIMSSIATDEVRKLSERVRWGQKRAIEKGNVIGNSRIFGYDKNNCKLVINEKEADMVRLIFELYATGDYSVKKIEQILYDKGYRSRNNTRIHHNTISGIIKNPKYKGYYCGNKVKITDYRTKEQRFLPQEEWIMYKDETGESVPAIVDEELWDRCNEIFKERSDAVKMKGHSLKSPSVFSGKLICAIHNVSYWRTAFSNSVKKGNPKYAWICGLKKRFNSSACPSFSILECDLYRIMGDIFKEILQIFSGDIDEFIKPLLDNSNSSAIQKKISALSATLQKEQSKREKLLDLYTEGVIDKVQFGERNDILTSSINDIRNQINTLQTQAEDNSVEQKVKAIKSQIEKICSSDKEITDNQIDHLVSVLVEAIYVNPIDENTMELTVKLISGKNKTIGYTKGERGKSNNFSSHLGNISNIMIPKRHYRSKRQNRFKEHHIHITCLIVEVGF